MIEESVHLNEFELLALTHLFERRGILAHLTHLFFAINEPISKMLNSICFRGRGVVEVCEGSPPTFSTPHHFKIEHQSCYGGEIYVRARDAVI